MNKESIYEKYAEIPEYDGTFSDHFKVYMAHPQQDVTILKSACEEFSSYVLFCMEISTRHKSKLDGKYKQFPYLDSEELDYDDYEIDLFHHDINIYCDTDLSKIDYPNIKGLVKIVSLCETYRGVFTRLLDGESFLSE